METSTEERSVGYLRAVINSQENVDTSDVLMMDRPTIIVGGQWGNGRGIYVELPVRITVGTHNIGAPLVNAWYNHGVGIPSWRAEIGTITVHTIDMVERRHIVYAFDFIAVEQGGGGNRFKISGSADIRNPDNDRNRRDVWND